MQGARTDYDGVIEQADDGYEIGDEVDGGQGVAAARGDQRSVFRIEEGGDRGLTL